VFVDVVKAVEGPKISAVPSLVWFETADRFNSILPHALYFSSKSGFKFFGTFCDPETRLIPVFNSSDPNQVQLLSKVIVGASQAIEYVPSDQSKLVGMGMTVSI
jgi:hypothetical protein